MRSFLFSCTLLAVCAAPAAAQDARVFANINFGYQGQSQDLRQAAEFPLYDETGNWEAQHGIDGGSIFDIGAGVRVHRNWSIGVSFANRGKHTRDVSITAGVPHPIFTDTLRTATATATGLEHSERAVHLQALLHIPVTVEFDVALFAGPTFFNVEDTLIESVVPIEQGGDFSTVNLQTATSTQSNSAVGFNLGIDTRYMFTRNVGAGAMLRFSRGSVDLTNPAGSGGELKLDTGGLEIGAGLRFRF